MTRADASGTSGPPPARLPSLDALVVCAFAWLGAHLLVSGPWSPNPWRDLVRPEVWPQVPAWLPIPAPGTSLVEDPVNRLLAALAVGSSLLYAALDLLLGPGAVRRRLKALALGGCVAALLLLPCVLDMSLGQWHGRAWHGHDGGVLQTDQATDRLLEGRNPYTEDFLDTPQARQSDRPGFWRRLGGNPALYHLPYLPGSFVLPVPLRPIFRAVLGYYDPRMLYLLCFAACGLCVWALRGAQRPALMAGIVLCPLLVPFVVEGRNEVMVLAPMLGMALCLQRRRLGLALFLWGLACTVKQFAWLYAPFVLAYLLGPWPPTRRQLWTRLRPLLWAALPFVLLVGPFLIWDARSLWDDTIAFMAGDTQHPYPFGGTPGLGLANVLLYFGRVHSLLEPYNFAAWQLLLGGPLALALCVSLARRPDWRVLVASGTLLCGLFLYASRVLHVNYLGLILPLLAVAASSDE